MELSVLPIQKDELSWLMLEEANKEGWLYSEEDVDFYYHYSGNQISAIKVDNELAGCVILHASSGHIQGMAIRSAGFFLVTEKFRGQKIAGSHLWQQAITANINDTMLVCFHSVPRAIRYYERSGFLQTPLSSIFYALDVDKANYVLLQSVTSKLHDGTLKLIDSTQCDAIESYNKKLFPNTSGNGFRDFIYHWLQRPDAIIFAYYEQDIVKGYGVLTVCKKLDEKRYCYRLSPLYADSIEIADHLIRALVSFAVQKGAQRIELNSLADAETEFAHMLAAVGFTACGKNYIVCNKNRMIDKNNAILKNIFTSLPLEFPHEVVGGIA